MIWLLKVYQHALKVHPIRTAAISAGTLMTVGDAIAQTVVEKKKLSKFDFRRSFRFVFFGTFLAFQNFLSVKQHGQKKIKCKVSIVSQLRQNAAVAKGTLLSVGDVLAQLVVEKVPLEKYNAKRTVRFAFFGTFFGGPLFSIWYSQLARKFGHAKYGPIKMVACDQLLFAPPFIAYFLIVMEILKGESLQDIKLKLQDDYLDVMKTNYKIWPAVQAINFTFVPVHYRVVLVNVVAVFWNTYLAWMSEKGHTHPEQAQTVTEDETKTDV